MPSLSKCKQDLYPISNDESYSVYCLTNKNKQTIKCLCLLMSREKFYSNTHSKIPF